MKTKTLLGLLSNLLNSDDKDAKKEIKDLRNLLAELKQKQIKYKQQRIFATDSIEKEELNLKLDVINAQRHKGVEKLLSLRQQLRNEA